MKRNLVLLSIFLISVNLFAGVSCGNHDRGMYVDCMDEIINEKQNNNSGPWTDLINYAHHNCFSYVALFGLDQGIMGDPAKEDILSDMINVFHIAGIQVGAIGSSASFFNDNFMHNPHWTDPIQYEQYAGKFTSDEITILSSITNPPNEASFSKKVGAEISKFHLHSFVNYNANHSGKIDVLSLEYEYWNLPYVTPPPPQCDREAEYQTHKDILTVMQIIKSASTSYPLLVEDYLADFNNAVLTNSGPCQVPETTQVDQLDQLADRILLTTYNGYPSNLFKRNCLRLQLLGSDSKSGTVIWPLLSAESSTWPKHDCQGTILTDATGATIYWEPFLGDYLTSNLSNGLELVDDTYFTEYNGAFNSTTSCPDCIGCTWTNGDNANLTTLMWFGYSLLADPSSYYHYGNWVSRKKEIAIPLENYFNSFDIYPNPVKDEINLVYSIDNSESKGEILIYSVDGRMILKLNVENQSNSVKIHRDQIQPGLYYCKLIIDGRLLDVKSIVFE